MLVLIDAGHGANTPGKCSPDQSLREYSWAREIAGKLFARLAQLHIPSYILVPEETDVPLSTRTKRANELIQEDTILVSIHVNAMASDGCWHNASGWGVYVSGNASKNSRRLATNLTEAARTWESELKIRVPSDSQPYWIQNLAICRDTRCPAVLIENLFQDNKADVEYLKSEPGKVVLTEIMVEGICKYFEKPYTNE